MTGMPWHAPHDVRVRADAFDARRLLSRARRSPRSYLTIRGTRPTGIHHLDPRGRSRLSGEAGGAAAAHDEHALQAHATRRRERATRHGVMAAVSIGQQRPRRDDRGSQRDCSRARGRRRCAVPGCTINGCVSTSWHKHSESRHVQPCGVRRAPRAPQAARPYCSIFGRCFSFSNGAHFALEMSARASP